MLVIRAAAIVITGLLVASVLAFATSLRAETGVAVKDAWIPLAPPNMKVHAGYLELSNSSSEPRYLVDVSSPAYKDAELHVSRVVNDVATMEHLAQIELPPGKTVVFAPGGLHVMLMGSKSAQKEGQNVELTLVFQNGEKLKTTAKVKAAKDQMHDHSHHGHGTHKKKGM